ncbi:unnamed protein product [Effrenium voratum]|nr:unnamed protein product [Effrenium voratum]
MAAEDPKPSEGETGASEPSGAGLPRVAASREACVPLSEGDDDAEIYNPRDVWVHIYHCDPYTGFLNRMMLNRSEIGIYHAGIEVYGEEWSFQYFEDTWNDPTISGIMRCLPKQMAGYEYQESLNLGPTPLSQDEVDDLLEGLSDEYSASTYHLTHRNCLTFAQHLAKSLKAPKEFPPWILGILDASTKLGALDATVDYFWSWAKWYMIRKHEPPEEETQPVPSGQANSWSFFGLNPSCSPSMCPGPAKREQDSSAPHPNNVQSILSHDEILDRPI